MKTLHERFITKIKVADGGCWEWIGSKDRRGYGQIWDRSLRPAHRVAYEFYVGEIPSGLHVCHHCDNPPCVNPDHLFAGTRSDNARDAIEKGRWHSPPRRDHCPQGHPLTGENVYVAPPHGWRSCRECRRNAHRRWLRRAEAPETSEVGR